MVGLQVGLEFVSVLMCVLSSQFVYYKILICIAQFSCLFSCLLLSVLRQCDVKAKFTILHCLHSCH